MSERDAVHRKRRNNNQWLLNSKHNQLNLLNSSVSQRIHDANNVAWNNSSNKSRTHSDERNVLQVRRRLNGQLDLCDNNSRRAKESHRQDDSDSSNDA